MSPRSVLLVGVGVLAVGLALTVRSLSLLERTELATVDTRLKIRGEKPAPGDVAVVAIDAKSQSALRSRYPFNRALHARLIDTLRRIGVRAIGYDVEFAQRTSRRSDHLLLKALDRAPSLVLETTKVRAGEPAVVFGRRRLAAGGTKIGAGIASVERDGEIHRIDYSLEGIPSFAVLVAGAAGTPAESLRPRETPFWIDFAGPPGTFRSYSFSDVLGGLVPSSALRGKIVMVGAIDPVLQDLHATPPSGQLMPGVEVWANAVATAVGGFPLRAASSLVNTLALILLGFLCPLLAIRFWVAAALFATVVALAAFAVGAQIAFEAGEIVQVTYPALALALGITGTVGVELGTATRDRRRARGILSRYMDPTIASQALRSSGDDARLPSKEVEATVLFCDLRGFTRFAATRSPLTVVEVQNKYLTLVSESVQKWRGTIISYLGDGAMIVFGAPVEDAEHATQALHVAREIIETQLPSLNSWLRESDSEESFGIGIGIASGRIVSGSIGSGWRLEYTATGDATNLAAKLQGLARGEQSPILLADSTRAALPESERVRLRPAGRFLPGEKSKPVILWAVCSTD